MDILYFCHAFDSLQKFVFVSAKAKANFLTKKVVNVGARSSFLQPCLESLVGNDAVCKFWDQVHPQWSECQLPQMGTSNKLFMFQSAFFDF